MIFADRSLRHAALGSLTLSLGTLVLAGCPSDPAPVDAATTVDTGTVVAEDGSTTEDAALPPAFCLDDVEAGERLAIAGLSGPVEVVYDERGIPHIYGTTIHDVVMAQGYLMARDRYGQMDFIRRSVVGRLAEVAGTIDPSTIEMDYEARVAGYARMGRAIYDSLSPTSRSRVQADAFAAGVNAYIAAVDARIEDPRVRGGDLINLLTPRSVDREWTGADIFAMARFQSASLSFDAGADVSRTALLAAAREAFPAGDPRAGIYRDLFDDTPARPVYTRDGFNDGSTRAMRRPAPRDRPSLTADPMPLPSRTTLQGAEQFFGRMEQMFERLGFGDESRGSNNWLVAGSLTESGNPIMSNDPHLSLISPAIWWYVHLNTARMGGEDALDVEGVAFAGLPGVVLGFNQHIAWGATTTGYDVTDVYLEHITAGVDGAPDTVAFDADGDGTLEQVPIRVEEEEIRVGRSVETRTIEYVTTHGPAGTLSPIIPGSRQPIAGSPGEFTALSVRYTGYEVSDELAYFAGLATATNVAEATEAQDNFRVGAQNFIVADATSIGWSTESRIPTRPAEARSLAYEADGTVTGHCPIFVLPGQGGFEWGDDLDSRWVPHDRDPARGWIATANQDNVGVTDDGNPCNDAHYIGGDYDLGWREWRIQQNLTALAARGDITTADMIQMQAESRSALGEALAHEWASILGDASIHVTGLTPEQEADLALVSARLAAWTSFQTPEATTSTDADEIADSVATTIFNGILSRVGALALADEQARLGRSIGSSQVARFVEHSFVGSPARVSQLAIYWDDSTTDAVTETKEEILVRATLAALTFLRDRLGADVDTWRWGRLHTVRFSSVLPTVGTDVLSIPATNDPTYPDGFPRHGDYGSVDPGQFGLWNSTSFSFGSGASQRLVVEVTPDGPIAFNALPGGQSIDPDSRHKADEALLWIRNEQPRVAFQESEIRAALDRCLVIDPR